MSAHHADGGTARAVSPLTRSSATAQATPTTEAKAKADEVRTGCPSALCLLLLTHGGMDCWCRKRKQATA